jgi:prevent-host-death family protein
MLLSATVVAGDAKSVQGIASDDRPDYDDYMREIEASELKARLDSVLREVEDGETVTVTSGGRPVAEIVPAMPERSETMKKLIAEGRVTPATKPLPMSPPSPIDTGTSASELILAEREEER